jgi:hypothetical protein
MRTLLPLSLLFLTGLLPAQRTFVVDAMGGADCTDIQTCVNRAARGDRVLVRPGVYKGFTASLGILILGAGPSVSVESPVVLQNLPSGQTLTLGGMKLSFPTQPQTPTSVLSIVGAGTVILADLDIDPGQRANARSTTEAAGIYTEKSSIVASRVTSKGADGTPGPGPIQPGHGGAGIACLSSTVAASGCKFTGGAGGVATQGGSAPGGEGCFAQDSFLVFGGTSSAGGAGATFTPSSGGDGVRLENTRFWAGSSAADRLDGGATPPNTNVPISAGLRATTGSHAFYNQVTITAGNANGQSIVFDRSSSVQVQSHPALTGTSPVQRGSTAVYTVHGQAGKPAALFLGIDAAPLAVPGVETPVWLPGPRGLLFFLGVVVVGNSGSVDFRLPIPQDPTLAERFVVVEGIGWLDAPPFVATAPAVTVIR